MGRTPCCAKEGLNRGTWTALEDRILTAYIKAHGEGNWRNLPRKAGLKRCGKSCRLRWLNYLKPDIKRGNISHDEEELIIRLHNLLGNRWALIAGRIPGRTDNEIKNYWNSTLSKKAKLLAQHSNNDLSTPIIHKSSTSKRPIDQAPDEPPPAQPIRPRVVKAKPTTTTRCTTQVLNNPAGDPTLAEPTASVLGPQFDDTHLLPDMIITGDVNDNALQSSGFLVDFEQEFQEHCYVHDVGNIIPNICLGDDILPEDQRKTNATISPTEVGITDDWTAPSYDFSLEKNIFDMESLESLAFLFDSNL